MKKKYKNYQKTSIGQNRIVFWSLLSKMVFPFSPFVTNSNNASNPNPPNPINPNGQFGSSNPIRFDDDEETGLEGIRTNGMANSTENCRFFWPIQIIPLEKFTL